METQFYYSYNAVDQFSPFCTELAFNHSKNLSYSNEWWESRYYVFHV